MANGDDLGFVPAAKPGDDLGFVPARKPAQAAPPPGFLQRIGQGLEKWWTTPTEDLESPRAFPPQERRPPPTYTSPSQRTRDTAASVAAMGAPLLRVGLAEAPLATGLGLAGGTVGGVAGGAAGRYLGGKIGAPTLGEDVGGLTGSFFGGMAGGGMGSPGARRALARTVIDPATLEPRPLAKALPLLGKERATAIGDMLDPNLPKVRNMTAAADASFQNRANELGQMGKQETLLGQENAKAVQRDLQDRQAEPPPRPARIPPLRWPQVGEAPPMPGRTRIGSFDFPTTIPEAESVPGAKGEAWSMQRTSSPELQRAVESGDPGAVETARRLNPNYRPIIIPKGASLEAKPLPFTGPPSGDISSQIQPRPFTIANAMGIRWAKTPGLPDISIPNGMAEEDIPAYVAGKQALQSKGITSILGNK